LPSALEMERHVPALRRARAEAHRGSPISIDTPLPAGERFATADADDPLTITTERAVRACVREALEALPSRERALLVAHYYGERSLRALSTTMNVSPQRVSQLHLGALGRLRRRLDGQV
jgi:RNA polymerase sigma factor (sigma-70 family)